MFKAKYVDLYKKKGNDGSVRTVFRYELSGKPADIERYKAILDGRGIPVYDGKTPGSVIYFDTVFRGYTCQVVITDTEKIVVANQTLDMLQSQLQLATDPALKAALANVIAQQIVANTMGTATPAPMGAPSLAPEAAQVAEEEANLGE